MNRVFRKVDGNPVSDISKHTLDILNECPYVEIHVGTDSQNHRRSTVYVTAIAYRYGNRGVHYIYHKHKVKKIRDKWTRLWNEADYNYQEKHFSSKLVGPAVGWINSLGYKANIKPHNQIATRAADFHCR